MTNENVEKSVWEKPEFVALDVGETESGTAAFKESDTGGWVIS